MRDHSERLDQLNRMGVSQETIDLAVKIVNKLGLDADSYSFSYFADIDEEPMSLTIWQPSTGLHLQICHFEPEKS